MVFEKSLVIIGISIVLGTLTSHALSRTLYEASIAEKYDLWMLKYERIYPDSEEQERRFAIFKSNVEYVEKFNRDGNNTYKLGLDEFADLSHEDFVQQHTGYIKPTEQTSSADVSFRYESLGGPDVPLSIDWRMDGAVTTVKNQGPCGTKYWILKNEWGERWGENGYMRIHRDASPLEDLCGLATPASYPIID